MSHTLDLRDEGHFPAAEQLKWLGAVAEVGGITGADVSLPADRFIDLNGIRFHYLDWGGDGISVVFLHGGALTAHTFDGVWLALRSRYRCLSLDLRGHGDTEWPAEVDDTLDTSAADLGAFID